MYTTYLEYLFLYRDMVRFFYFTYREAFFFLRQVTIVNACHFKYLFTWESHKLPFNAITFDAGFMIAESAEIGLLVGFVASARSTITTCAVSPTFSLTQMYLSDSIVRVEKPMLAELMPMFWSYKKAKKCWFKFSNHSFKVLCTLSSWIKFSMNILSWRINTRQRNFESTVKDTSSYCSAPKSVQVILISLRPDNCDIYKFIHMTQKNTYWNIKLL